MADRAAVSPSLRHDTSGSTAVEFALIFPVLAMFILGIWYTGWAINCGSEVQHAVELGSRVYLTNPSATATDLQNAVSSHLIDVPIGSITLNAASQSIGLATSEHITWSYQTSAPIPFMSAVGYTFSGAVDVPMATP